MNKIRISKISQSDLDLINERVIEKFSHIENIEASGEPVGQYKLQNKIVITINNLENIDIDKIKRNFLYD